MALQNSRTADKFIARLEDGMRERLKAVSKKTNRSMNSELLTALTKHLDEVEGLSELMGVDLTDMSPGLTVQAWTPRVGDLVQRKDTKRVLGPIHSFRLSGSTIWADMTPLGDMNERETSAVALLEPVDISDIIRGSGHSVIKALRRANKLAEE